jgi:hypothetical protein
MSVMIESTRSGAFSEQELQALFRQYLPAQPVPPALTSRVTSLVLQEVETRWPKKRPQPSWVNGAALQDFFYTYFLKRR